MADIDDRWHRRDANGNLERTERYGMGARWLLRWREPDGRQRKKSFKRKAEAEKYAAHVEHSMLSGSYVAPDAGKVTLDTWARGWLEAQAHIAPTTYDRSAGIVRTHIEPAWGTANLSDITHSGVQKWVTGLSHELSPASVIKVHRLLSLILAWAVRNGRLTKNPAEGVNLPRVPANERRYLNHRQVHDLAKACGDYGLVVRFLAYTGLRWGEMAALRAHRFDPDRRRIEVAESVTEVNGRLVWGAPKTHERRSVPLPRFIADELAKHLVDKGDQDLIFTSPKGGVLRVRNFRRTVFDPAVKTLGVSGLHPHELRHTAASLAIAAGADVKLVQQMLGHKTATLTLDLYGHLFPDRLNDVADRIDRIVGDPNVPHDCS